MFYFRLNKMTIFDNEESKFLWHKDEADVRIVSFITTGNNELPNLGEWIGENDETKKKQVLAGIIDHVVAKHILTEVEHVKDGQTLTFGDTGYVVYQTEKIPQDFNWCLLVLNSKQDLRDLGEQIGSIVDAPEFDSFAASLAILVAGAVNPSYIAGVAIAKFITMTTASVLKQKGDKQLGLLYMSLNRTEHYLHGERKRDDVPDLTGNLRIDYSIFGFDSSDSSLSMHKRLASSR